MYSLNDRLRFFHGTVTPTILYGSETWTMTKELEQQLQRTQRKILRMIDPSEKTASYHSNMQHPEEPSEESLEPWHEWIERCTHEAKQRVQNLQMRDWVHLQRQRKWRWAGKMATKGHDCWIIRALT